MASASLLQPALPINRMHLAVKVSVQLDTVEQLIAVLRDVTRSADVVTVTDTFIEDIASEFGRLRETVDALTALEWGRA
jgi:hypothetical protein